MSNKRIKILNSYLDCLTMDETIQRIVTAIENRENIQHVVINASKVNMIQKDTSLLKIINSCPIINADGQAIVWAGRFLGHDVPERVAGIDLFYKLVEVCSIKGYKPYFFGAKQEVVETVVSYFKGIYPDLNVAGYRNGYFTQNEYKQIALEIKNSNADVLFVAFSSPMKEYWINEHIDIMQVPFSMGVGGSFDVVAGVTTRAPIWMQKMGLEWFHRFIQEPKRMFKRYIIGNLKFCYLVIKEKMRGQV